MLPKPTFAEYLWAFTSRWSTLMSGPLSVPAAIAATLVENWIARIVLAATALICLLFSSYSIWRIEREKRTDAENEITHLNDFTLTDWGNVRVADNPPVIELFQSRGPEHNKLLGLLTQEHISCWARRFTAGESELVKVSGSVWNAVCNFNFNPKNSDDERTINQTFLRDDFNRPLFYDLYLNSNQLKRVWPTMELSETTGETRNARRGYAYDLKKEN